MKYDPIKNPNYVATVIEVPELIEFEGLDNLRGLALFGMQALVSKDTVPGTIGVLFSTEVQLSEEFASANNLFRHSNLNSDQTKVGYLEDNRRVKAIKLRGVRSDSLFVGLDAFTYLGVKPEDFKVGDVFDSINGKEVLRKYVIKEPAEQTGPKARVRRVDLTQFPMHIDSENYWRNCDKIPFDAPVVVTQKLHGTSVRYGNVLVKRDLKWYEKLLVKVGVPIKTHEHKFVVGSRTVIKSIDGETEDGKQHYYGETDLWSQYAYDNALNERIPEGYLVYGELVGWTSDGKPIQKNYTYECPKGEAKLYIYRVATVTEGGVVTDLSWPAVKAFARGIGMATVPEFFTELHDRDVFEIVVDDLMDERYLDNFLLSGGPDNQLGDRPVGLSNGGTVDEGICVRYDGPNGVYILKAKSPIFLGHESRMLDTGGEDLESEESTNE